jgi:hypothetical protein
MGAFGKIYLVVSSVVIIVLFGLLMFVRGIPSEALVVFLGVLVGSLITSFGQYLLSEGNMRQQARLAALDRRLEAAQQAHTLWLHISRLFPIDEASDPFVESTLRESRQWWDKNSLYLTAEARRAFMDAFKAAIALVSMRAEGSLITVAREYAKDIESAGRIIEESVYLPAIGELETKRNRADSKEGDA